jgi:hypothetical protein
MRSAARERYEQKGRNGANQNRQANPTAEMGIGLRQAEHVYGRIRAMKQIGTGA